MEIKKEEPKDYAEIYEVVKRAFNSAECADGNEQDLVNALRTGAQYPAKGMFRCQPSG